MTVREMLKELKKEAKRNGIIDYEIKSGALKEESLLLWIKLDEKDRHSTCFKMGYLSTDDNVIMPFIGKF